MCDRVRFKSHRAVIKLTRYKRLIGIISLSTFLCAQNNEREITMVTKYRLPNLISHIGISIVSMCVCEREFLFLSLVFSLLFTLNIIQF